MFYLVILVFIAYVSLESLGGIARFGGFSAGYISIGVSLQNQILSLNRFIGFLIAPLVGFYVDTGGTSDNVFWIGIIGGFFGGVVLILVFLLWGGVTSFFRNISNAFVEGGYNIKSILIGGKAEVKIIHHTLNKVKLNYFLAQFITTGLAMPSVFLLNIIAIKIPEYSSTLLQMTTLISGFGNLILNFYTNPLISVEESKLTQEDAENSHKSIFLGKVFGMLILSPIIICLSLVL